MNLKTKTTYSDYYSEYFGDITIEKVKYMLQENDLNRLCLFYRMMLLKDTHIFSEVNKRQSQLNACPFAIIGDDKKSVDFINSYFAKNNRLQQIMRNLLSAIPYGFSVTDLVWDIEDGKFVPTPYHLPQNLFYSDKNGLYLIQKLNKKLYIEDNDKFFIHLHTSAAGSIADIALLKNLIWLFTIKAYVIANYSRYVNMLGVPPIIVQHDTDKPAEIVDAVLELRSASVGAFPKDAVIELLEGKASPDMFFKFIEYADLKISQTVLGSTLTTQVDKTGSYAAAKTHNEVRLDYLKSDAALIESSINNLIQKIHKFNFNHDRYPRFKFDKIEYLDEKTRAETLQILYNMGLEIPASHIYDEFNIPEPEKNSTSLQVSSPPLAGNGRKIESNKKTDNFIPADEIDRQANQAKTEPLEEEIYSALENILKNVSSYSDAFSKLLKAYPKIKLDKLEEVLMKYIANSEIYGHVEDNDLQG